MDAKRLVHAYMQTLPKSNLDQGNLFVIGLIGLPGSGKSTFSSALASRMGFYIASNDKIRRWLEAQAGIVDYPQSVVELIAEASTKYLLENNISHIIDADLIKHQDTAKAIARSYNAEFYIFKVETPIEEIRHRIEKRSSEIFSPLSGQLSRAGMQELKERRLVHPNIVIMSVDLTIDGTKNTIHEVDRVVDFINERKIELSINPK